MANGLSEQTLSRQVFLPGLEILGEVMEPDEAAPQELIHSFIHSATSIFCVSLGARQWGWGTTVYSSSYPHGAYMLEGLAAMNKYACRYIILDSNTAA